MNASEMKDLMNEVLGRRLEKYSLFCNTTFLSLLEPPTLASRVPLFLLGHFPATVKLRYYATLLLCHPRYYTTFDRHQLNSIENIFTMPPLTLATMPHEVTMPHTLATMPQ